MMLNDHNVSLCCFNVNEYRPILSAAKNRPMSVDDRAEIIRCAVLRLVKSAIFAQCNAIMSETVQNVTKIVIVHQ